MTEIKGVGTRRTQLHDDLRNKRKYWKLKMEAKFEKYGIDSLSIEHKEGIEVIFHKFMDLLVNRILNNNSNNI